MKRFVTLISMLCLVSGCSLLPEKNADREARLVTINKPDLQLQHQWARSIGNGDDHLALRLTPFIQGHYIYTASSDGTVNASNTINGDTQWMRRLPSPITSAVGHGEGYLLVGTADGFITALHQSNGSVAWKTNLQAESIAPAIAVKGKVFVKTIAGSLVALNSQSGKQLWDYTVPTPQLMLRANSAPQVVGNEVIVGFAGGDVVALNKNDGQVVWRVESEKMAGGSPIEQMVDVAASPKIKGEKVFVVNYQGELSALNRKTGAKYWHHKLSSYSGMSIGDDALFVTDSDSHLWAFDLESGHVLWKQQGLHGRDLSAPTLIGKHVVVGDSHGYLHCLSQQDGHFMARMRVDKSSIQAAPLAKNNDVYVYTSSGTLAKYRFQGLANLTAQAKKAVGGALKAHGKEVKHLS